jgi:hypothetical protein
LLTEKINNLTNEEKLDFKLLKDELKTLKNGNKGMTSPNSHTSFSQPHQSSNSNTFNGSAHKVTLTIPNFDNEDDRKGTRWIDKIQNYFDCHHILDVK